MTDQPTETVSPTHFIGFCDTCRSAKTFTTAHAREQWEKHHPHQEDYSA